MTPHQASNKVLSQLATKCTNHSLRAYGVTRLFQLNVPDKCIMERGGHRSTEGLREYQWTDVLQELQVCKALDSAPTGKRLCNQVATAQPPLAAQSVPGFSGCTFNNCRFSLLHYQPYPKRQMQQSLPCQSHWHRPGRAFRLTLTISRNTALCLYCICQQLYCFHC